MLRQKRNRPGGPFVTLSLKKDGFGKFAP